MGISGLNVSTQEFAENRRDGLMICGINWGGDPDHPQALEEASFFSDRRVNDYPYRNRLVKWFALLGHPFATEVGRETPFDRSIVQTNWLPSQSLSMKGRSIHAECIKEWANFELHVAALMPRLIVLVGVSLLEVLSSDACREKATRLLGLVGSAAWTWSPRVIGPNGKAVKRSRVGVQVYQRATVISLPHPTGPNHASDAQIRALAEVVSPHIATFKAQRGFEA